MGLSARRNVALLAFALQLTGSASAESLLSALARAYSGNPDLNQSRAAVRVRDEESPKALSGMRPKANIQASVGSQYGNLRFPAGRNSQTFDRVFTNDEYVGYPRGTTLNMSQNLFDGGRTENSVKQAESNIFAARATMRLTEQATLQNGATAYMNVLRDTAVVDLRKKNIAVLEQQLKQTRDRFQVGEVTRTDVAQAEASLAQARSELYSAQAMLKNSVANYRQIIGADPNRLEPGRSVETLVPKSINDAIQIALVEHPGAVAALHQVDAAEMAVKVAESALSPTVSVGAQVSNQYDSFLGIPGTRQFSAGAVGQLNIPIYQGGVEFASIRQAKEQLAQARLNARVSLVISQRDRVVASYAVLGAIGRLTAQEIGLDVAYYDPNVHYQQVKTKWFGVDTPDGR